MRQIIEEKLRPSGDEVILEFKLQPLHKRNEAHKARFCSTVVICGKEVASGEGGSRREAEEIACQKAMSGPVLEDLLEQALARSRNDSD